MPGEGSLQTIIKSTRRFSSPKTADSFARLTVETLFLCDENPLVPKTVTRRKKAKLKSKH
jgi:hypothetical protein